MLYEDFIKLCSSRGVGLDLKKLFAAFDRRQHGGTLSSNKLRTPCPAQALSSLSPYQITLLPQGHG